MFTEQEKGILSEIYNADIVSDIERLINKKFNTEAFVHYAQTFYSSGLKDSEECCAENLLRDFIGRFVGTEKDVIEELIDIFNIDECITDYIDWETLIADNSKCKCSFISMYGTFDGTWYFWQNRWEEEESPALLKWLRPAVRERFKGKQELKKQS